MEKECGHNVKLIGNKCYRCKHEWLSADKNVKPKVCPRCKSPYWDTPRKKKYG